MTRIVAVIACDVSATDLSVKVMPQKTISELKDEVGTTLHHHTTSFDAGEQPASLAERGANCIQQLADVGDL